MYWVMEVEKKPDSRQMNRLVHQKPWVVRFGLVLAPNNPGFSFEKELLYHEVSNGNKNSELLQSIVLGETLMDGSLILAI